RSVRETDHLRLRISTNSPNEYAKVASTVGAWGQQVCQTGAASRWTLATYHPEVGRYGAGAAMDAAEAVFAADSHAVALAHQLLGPPLTHPGALAAIGRVDSVDGFYSAPKPTAECLLKHTTAKATTYPDRAVADQVAVWVGSGTLPDGTELPA